MTTVYVGANADLVRGFITTPLERVIASADGIDYLESSSAQGVSTITVHLKLNYDTNAALTQIQAKVAQVRNDLPPEAQAPIIDLQTADAQFAAMYLGFSSNDLDQNQITDYLTRVVQPKLTRRSAACSAPTSSAAARSPCASGSSRTGWPRSASRPRRCATRSPRTTTSRRSGATKGSMVSVNLVANTDLQTRRRVPAARGQADRTATIVRLGDIADVVLGAENYDQRRALQRPDRDLHGHLGAADRELARRDQAGARGDAGDPGRSCRPA